MKLEILSPSVEDSKETDLRPEMFRICRDGSQCFGGGPEENAQD